jgi:trk system potassium uptake protein TrkH
MRTGRIASANLRALYQKILSYTGLILFLSGLLMLVPIIVIFFRPLELTYIRGFIIPSLLLSIIGYLMWKLFKRSESVILTVQEGRVIVLISWIIVMIFSA